MEKGKAMSECDASLDVRIVASRGPIRLIRKFYCPTCGAQHLTPIHPPRQGPDRFVMGIFFGLVLAGGIWFALGFVWVAP